MVVILEYRISGLAEYLLPSVFGKLNILKYPEIITSCDFYFLGRVRNLRDPPGNI